MATTTRSKLGIYTLNFVMPASKYGAAPDEFRIGIAPPPPSKGIPDMISFGRNASAFVYGRVGLHSAFGGYKRRRSYAVDRIARAFAISPGGAMGS